MRIKRTIVQSNQWAVVDAIDGKLSDIAKQRNLLINCGLDREAERLNGEIVRLNAKRKSLIEDIERDRQRLALYIPRILLLCDKLTELSSEFASEICKVSNTKTKNNFSELVDKNIEDTRKVMKQWEKAVVIIDEVNDKPLSFYFADMSEEFSGKVGNLLEDYITELSKTKEFKKFF